MSAARTSVGADEVRAGDVIEGPVRVTKVETDDRTAAFTVELVQDTVVRPLGT
jgi:hypothetical protein